MRSYTRWTVTADGFRADLVDCVHTVTADPTTGLVTLSGQSLTPDAARLIGVRLIEAAVLADGQRTIRTTP